jgi:uncharacterized protein
VGAQAITDNETLAAALRAGSVDVAGATSWAWAREEFEGCVDVLFVDEAGQVSLANVVAVAPAADSIVLLGDPQQLDQPIQGSHPPGADRSALAHLLGDRATMPSHLGLFLDGTWRLHPSICAYTSEAFYDGLLESYPGRERQIISGQGLLAGAGLRWIDVAHTDDSNESTDEAEEVARRVRSLIESGATWTDDEARLHRLHLDDVLVISPYNAQVGAIGQALPGANVGTVDKFQGQQAPVSIYSMASSSAEDAPRGMEFLYSLHRLNVATSRARCLAVVVGSPELVRVRCRTPRQMRLANGLARLIEMAAIESAPNPRRQPQLP